MTKLTWRKIAGHHSGDYRDSMYECRQHPEISRITIQRQGKRMTWYHVTVDESDDDMRQYPSLDTAMAVLQERKVER